MVLLNRSPLKINILLEVLSESKFKSFWEKILDQPLIFFNATRILYFLKNRRMVSEDPNRK